MRNQLQIFHRNLKGSAQQAFLAEPDLALWTTCVRSLLIGDPEKTPAQEADHVYTGVDATAFLTEIVAGLQSPMLGETEVHGQFKDFISQMEGSVDRDLFLELMSIHFLARKVRSEHIKGLGCQSYGSFARKKFREIDDLVVLGAGQLALEILPWLLKKRDKVTLVSRNPDSVNANFHELRGLKIVSYEEAPKNPEGLVITAPISSARFSEVFQPGPQLTLDLRAESRHDPLAPQYSAISLDQVFQEIERNKSQVQDQVGQAKTYIREASGRLEDEVGRHLRSIKVQ